MRFARFALALAFAGSSWVACGDGDGTTATGAGAGGGAHAGGAGGRDAGHDAGSGDAGAQRDAEAEGGAIEDAGVDAGPPPLVCGKAPLAPWSRKAPSAGAAVTFNELMYHPAGDAKLEWLELANPLGIEVDLSGFRLDGDVHFTFPDGTFLPARGFVVVAADAPLLAKALGADVALGSYTGKLPNGEGEVELWNNAGRLLDAVSYADVEPWPVIPDGSGASLAKRAPTRASGLAEQWTASAKLGGTPGAANFGVAAASPPPLTLVPRGATWRYEASGAPPPADWASLAFDDSKWASAPAPFYASSAAAGPAAVSATFTADNFFALYTGKADGTGLTLIGRDAVGDWTSPETFPFEVAPDDYLYVVAWEAPGDNGGPQSVIGEVALPGGGVLPTSPSTFEWVLGPAGASPGGAPGDPPPPPASLASLVAAANAGSSWAAPGAAEDKSASPWGYAVAGAFSQGTEFLWADTFGDQSLTNTNDTFVLLRSKAPVLAPKGATKLAAAPTTAYFRAAFDLPAGVTLAQPWLDALVDDGAVVYVDGVEALRLDMPNGAVGPATLASSSVGDAVLSPGHLVDAAALPPGPHVLAVELHQATAPNDPDLLFDAALRSSVKAPAADAASLGLALDEVAGASASGFWVELVNLGATPVDTAGFVVATKSGHERVLGAHPLAPGALWLVDSNELGFGAADGDKVFLLTPARDAVIDGALVATTARGRDPVDPTAWRYVDAPTPGAPNVVTVEAGVVINEIMYAPPPEKAPDGSIVKSSLEWLELWNRSAKPVDVGGWQLVDAIALALPMGLTLPPGGYLVVAKDVAAMKAAYPALAGAGPDALVGGFSGGLADSGDRVVLRDGCGNVVDSVRYADDGRWPALAAGGGSSLELRDARADHGAPEAWAPSDEASASTWQTITYEAVAKPSSVGPDGAYEELVIGLLDAGTVLLDDVSVIEDPAGAATELVQNGTFESGAAGAWRLLGNHRRAAVVDDPTQPGNKVLRVAATGPTEHMHNHLETTLLAGHAVQNGATYRVSLRAKWEGGSNLLNTRLYFDRLARTTELALPATHGTPGAANGRAEANLGPTYAELRHTPLVPQAYEPVEVSVVAKDPDGVGGLTLWTVVDDGAPSSVPMLAQGGGRYSALVLGAPATAVVQLWVSGSDAKGATSMFPAAGPASRVLYQVSDGAPTPNGLHPLAIVMTKADASWLFDPKNLMSNDPVGATIVDDDGEAFDDVGLRLKGSERGRPSEPRVGFALSFPSEHRLRGIHRSAMVDRSEGIGFGQRELFFNQAMNHAGSATSQYDDLVHLRVPRPELTGPAQLQLARFGDLLLDGEFDHGGDGVLFEYELIYYPLTTDDGTPQGYKLPDPDDVLGTDVHDLGDDEEAYRLPFILKNNRDRDDYRGLIRFAKAFGQSGPAFDASVGDVVDVDEWLRAFAFATLSGAVDNYAAGSQHNGNFYVRPSDGRVLYFPHDLDFYGGWAESPLVASPDLAKLVATPARARAYYGHVVDIVSTSYNEAYMAHWASHLGALVPAQDFAGHLAFVAARSSFALDAVNAAIPKIAFQITTNAGAPLAITTPTVALAGVGWVDVFSARTAKPAADVALTWTGATTWTATVAVPCGASTVELDAFDRHGAAVGVAKLAVTRTGAGCP